VSNVRFAAAISPAFSDSGSNRPGIFGFFDWRRGQDQSLMSQPGALGVLPSLFFGFIHKRAAAQRIGRTNSNLVETQSVEDHPQKPRRHDHPADRQRITNYQHENIIHGLPP
jgi:hypothetical protein